MPFKIVQTIEGGETCLCIVPSGWEEDGILRWPKKHLVVKLSLQEDSLPAENWQRINCINKRQFQTYEAAYEELDRMENQPDTEVEEAYVSRIPEKKGRQSKSKATHTHGKIDLNHIAETASQIAALPQTSSLAANINNQVTTNVPEILIMDADEEMETDSGTPLVFTPNPVVYLKPEDNGSNNAITTAIVANLQMVLENQSKIMQVLAKLVTAVDYLSQALREEPVRGGASTGVANMEDIMGPVNSVEELDMLEEKLKDDRVMLKYVQNMSFICGTSGKANGIDSCYKLVDFMLTRPFVQQCSWTGNSRAKSAKQAQQNGDLNSDAQQNGDSNSEAQQNGDLNSETNKVGLKFYKKFRALFLKLVMLSDKDFSEMECDVFLKRVIKNSKQRVNALTATSRHRNRPSNLKYKTKKSAANTDRLNNEMNNNDPPEMPIGTA